MTSPRVRTNLLAVAASGLLVLAACGSSAAKTAPTSATVADKPATTNAPPVAAVPNADGSVTVTVTVGTDDFDTTGGKRVVGIKKGANVTVQLTDAASDEQYHLHGYDLEATAKKGAAGTISFTATQTGQFDLESHITEKTLLVLFVS